MEASYEGGQCPEGAVVPWMDGYAFIVSTFFLCIRTVSSRISGCLRQELP